MRTLILLLTLTTLAGPAAAEKAPWAGSVFTYRNAATVPSFDKSTDLTYNPYYAMTFSFRPQWSITDILYLNARFSLTQEITHSDFTTDANEVWPSDLGFRFGAANFYTIPVVGIAFSTDLDIVAPTSKSSRARTMLLSLSPGVGISRSFEVLSGISLGYNFRFAYNFHESTTAERESPLIGGCTGGIAGCAQHLNMGLRNSEWRLTHSAFVSFAFTDWVALSASFAVITDYLYPAAEDASVSLESQPDQGQRDYLSAGAALTFTPVKALNIALGFDTTHPQLAPDSSFRQPVFNRYTMVFIDMTLNIAGLVSQIQGDN